MASAIIQQLLKYFTGHTTGHGQEQGRVTSTIRCCQICSALQVSWYSCLITILSISDLCEQTYCRHQRIAGAAGDLEDIWRADPNHWAPILPTNIVSKAFRYRLSTNTHPWLCDVCKGWWQRQDFSLFPFLCLGATCHDLVANCNASSAATKKALSQV